MANYVFKPTAATGFLSSAARTCGGGLTRRYASNMNRLLYLCTLPIALAMMMGCKESDVARDLASEDAGEIFRLEVRRSFETSTRFTLVQWYETNRRAMLVESEMNSEGEYENEQLIDLSDDQVERLGALLTEALRTDLVDAIEGLDGSTWCLETHRMHTEVRVCLWTPTYESSERGMNDFAALGQAVWEVAGAQEQFGDLY